jgi:hypothetical protein
LASRSAFSFSSAARDVVLVVCKQNKNKTKTK